MACAQVLVGGHDLHAAGDLVAGAVALALGLHLGVEAVHVHGQAVLAAADLVHQLGREAVGVVEDEGDGAGDGVAGASGCQSSVIDAGGFQQRRRIGVGGFEVVKDVLEQGHTVGIAVCCRGTGFPQGRRRAG